MMKLLNRGDIYGYLDGGTHEYYDVATDKIYFKDHRLETKTDGDIYTLYPDKRNAKIIDPSLYVLCENWYDVGKAIGNEHRMLMLESIKQYGLINGSILMSDEIFLSLPEKYKYAPKIVVEFLTAYKSIQELVWKEYKEGII